MTTATPPRDLASKRPANTTLEPQTPHYPVHRPEGGRTLRRYAVLLVFLLVIGYVAGFLGWL